MKSFIVGAALASALLAPGAAFAVTYDAFSSFDGSNPGGPFHYSGVTGLPVPPGPASVPLAPGGATCPLDSTCLLSPAGFGIDSGVYKAGAGTPSSIIDGDTGATITLPADQLIVSPDIAASIFFVAPFDGEFTFNAVFNALDSGADGVTIFRLAVDPATSTLILSPLLVGSFNGIPDGLTFSETTTLSAGQAYGFRIGKGGSEDDSHDLTGVNFSASAAVPEPATWAVMLLGFGGLGAMLRRRRAVGMAAIG